MIAAKRIDALDAVRALAIFPVIILHHHSDWAPGGAAGVGLFFGLSGYLIGNLLIERDQPNQIAAFVIRRVFRIYPMLIFALLVIGVCIKVSDPQNLGRFYQALPGLITMTRMPGMGMELGYGVAVMWSLHVEFAFYLCAAILTAMFGWRVGLWLLIAALLVFGIRFSFLMDQDQAVAMAEYPFFYWGIALGFGLLLSLILYRQKWTPALTTWCALVAGLFGFLLITFYWPSFLPKGPAGRWHMMVMLGSLFGCAIISSYALNPKLPVLPGLPFVGRISFSMYLVHALIVDYGQKLFGLNFFWRPFEYAGHVIVISAFTYFVVELSGIAIGAKVARLVGAERSKDRQRETDPGSPSATSGSSRPESYSVPM